MFSASPRDLCLFLAWKDNGGRTQIHTDSCIHAGKQGKFPCGCPCRLSAGTVDSLIGKLRALFSNIGRGGPWNDQLGSGNPAGSPYVKRYLKAMKEEQCKARVKPKQAVPIFMDKLCRLSRFIQTQMDIPSLSPLQKYILARDQAYFKLDMFSGDRPSDLGILKTQEILRFPNDDGFLFNHQFGKTLRGDHSNVFGVKRCQNLDVCPVRGLELYMKIADDLDLDIRNGCLFRTTSKEGLVVNEPVTSEAINVRLKSYLQSMGEYEGETAHGFRSGCAITLALTGAKLATIMEHVGWEREHTAHYYMQLAKVINPEGAANVLANVASDQVEPGPNLDPLGQLYIMI